MLILTSRPGETIVIGSDVTFSRSGFTGRKPVVRETFRCQRFAAPTNRSATDESSFKAMA